VWTLAPGGARAPRPPQPKKRLQSGAHVCGWALFSGARRVGGSMVGGRALAVAGWRCASRFQGGFRSLRAKNAGAKEGRKKVPRAGGRERWVERCGCMGWCTAVAARALGTARACAVRAGAVLPAPVRVHHADVYVAAGARVARTTPGCGGRLSANRARWVGGGAVNEERNTGRNNESGIRRWYKTGGITMEGGHDRLGWRTCAREGGHARS
jgi:hypothetical protein